MYAHPNIINSVLAGMVLSIGISFTATAQDKKPKKQVQVKIIENGKVRTDTSFSVENNLNPGDIDSLINSMEGNPDVEKLTPGKKHRKNMMFYRFDPMADMDNMDNMMIDMDREFNFKGDYDSIIAYKDGKREKMMNPMTPIEFDMPAPPCPGCMNHVKRFTYHNSPDTDSPDSQDVEERVIIRKQAGPGEKRMNADETDDKNYETVESSDDVTIKRKVSPGHQQIIIEKSNPDVTIKKGKKGRIEIIIEDKK